MIRGGIERYIKTFPEGGFWKGKNFLFDRRFEQVGNVQLAARHDGRCWRHDWLAVACRSPRRKQRKIWRRMCVAPSWHPNLRCRRAVPPCCALPPPSLW